MDHFQGNIGQKIARAASVSEQRRTKHGREWIAVFMNEETIVIALHGCLTASEKALAQSPAGAAQVQEFHQHLFTNNSAALFQKIKSITGMKVRDTSVEIDPMIGSVVQIFTTDTVLEKFLQPSVEPSEIRTLRAGVPDSARRDTVGPAARQMAPAAKPIQPLDCHPRLFARA